MALAKICPTCQGCGHTSLDQFGRLVPQPGYLSNNTTAQGWTKCIDCGGVGCLAIVEWFANGMSVQEYLQTWLGDM